MDETPIPLPARPRVVDPLPPPASFEEMMLRLAHEALALCYERQAKYGARNISAFGEVGCLIRANDKIERLKNLPADAADESRDDAWIDLCNYSLIALAVRRGWWTKDSCPPLLEIRG